MEAGKCPDCSKIYFSAVLKPGKRVQCPYCKSIFIFLKNYKVPLDKAKRKVNNSFKVKDGGKKK